MATAFCPFCGASLAGVNAVYRPRCSIATGFAGWSQVRAAKRMPLISWTFGLPGLIVAGGSLLSDLMVSWLFHYGPGIMVIRLLGALVFDVARIVRLGILAGALSYSALCWFMAASPRLASSGTGATP
ncbi:MAG TPA: hypothetical protein VFU88_20675 [Ktedonobacterales bacterium]|nr:hypothetical protein [Ktedonobacterales bacterium]